MTDIIPPEKFDTIFNDAARAAGRVLGSGSERRGASMVSYAEISDMALLLTCFGVVIWPERPGIAGKTAGKDAL